MREIKWHRLHMRVLTRDGVTPEELGKSTIGCW